MSRLDRVGFSTDTGLIMSNPYAVLESGILYLSVAHSYSIATWLELAYHQAQVDWSPAGSGCGILDLVHSDYAQVPEAQSMITYCVISYAFLLTACSARKAPAKYEARIRLEMIPAIQASLSLKVQINMMQRPFSYWTSWSKLDPSKLFHTLKKVISLVKLCAGFYIEGY